MVGEHSYSLLFSPAIYDSKHVPKISFRNNLNRKAMQEHKNGKAYFETAT